MKSQTPTFKERSVLFRYIDPEFRSRKNRPKAGSYQLSSAEKELSVNSGEMATTRQVAQVYADNFEGGQRPVALSGCRLAQYNDGGIASGAGITFNDKTMCWEFIESGNARDAYKHDPKFNNPSHCGVQFLRILDDHKQFKFAVRLARSATYKMV